MACHCHPDTGMHDKYGYYEHGYNFTVLLYSMPLQEERDMVQLCKQHVYTCAFRVAPEVAVRQI